MSRLLIYFLPIGFVFFSLSGQAAEISYCTDLASASCKQSSILPDGTGTRYFRSPEEISAALMPAFERAKPKIDSAILQGLWSSTPEGKGHNSLQGKAIRAYGLNRDSESGCQVLAPTDEKIRAEVQAFSSARKTELIRSCNLRLRDLLFEHIKIQSLSVGNAKGKFPLSASPEAMLDLEDSVEFKSVQAFVGNEVEKEALNSGLDQRIRDVFPDVKRLMIARIRSMGLPAQDEERAVARISETTYKPGTCSISLRANRLYDANAFLSTDAQGKSTFSFCPAFLLSTDSEFSLVAVMAHEMGHAIDPCRMGSKIQYNKKEFDPGLETIFDRDSPIQPLLGCLRNENSVGAVSCPLEALKAREKKLDCEDDPVGCMLKEKKLDGNDSDLALQIHPCHDDQINEAVADWFGAETLESYMREKRPGLTREQFRAGVSNAFRPLCSEADLEVKAFACGTHPPPPKRIERIINANPRLRSRMGCGERHSKGHLYCDRGPMPQNVLGSEGSSAAPVKLEQTGGIK